MQSIEYYVGEVKRLGLEHNEHFREITEDGVIDYGEALDTRQLIRDYYDQLQVLKRQASADIAELHHIYGEKILVAQQSYAGDERTAAIQQLRQEEQRMREAFEIVIERIDFLQVGIPQNHRLIENHIATLERDMQAITSATTYQPHIDNEDEPVSDMLQRVLKNWRALLADIDSRYDTPQTPQQNAYDAGVERALQMAIRDVEDVLAVLR